MLSPLVSIVILNWNGRKFLEQFLPSVVASTYSNFNIVVADNASTDDSIPFLRSYYPLIRIIELKKNFGFAKGYNEALKQVQADYYVLLNSDVEVTPSWIKPVISLMENDRKIAACQPKLLLYSDRGSFEYSGACGGWIDRLGYPFARGRIFDVCERDNGQYDASEPIFWASGAAMFVRAEQYHQLGGLDEYFFAHQEEIDFCWRLQRAGYLIYCCPDSVVYHVGGGTLPKGNSRKVFLNFRNNLIMMAKNMGIWEGFWKINYRFLLDTISAFKSLLAGEGRYFLAVFRAHAAFLWWLVTHLKRSRHTGDKTILKGYLHRSVVWAHFVLGMKKFSEIVGPKN
ncbi:MAG: glycosyltransferase family 2 protein [Chitinophagaceae bacterium]|nr:glycosyltransferase family 2 protein [Chitinophagaceae bacterium]